MSGVLGRRLLTVAAVILLAVGATGTVASSALAAGPTGEVYVVHAIAGATVDVFVDGEPVGPGTAPKTVLGPLDLEAGPHDVEIKDAGGATVVASKITVKAGTSTDVVAHVRADAAKTPTITAFPNNTKPIGPGKVRMVVTHVAAAPPADILVDGEPMFRNVANGESLWIDAPAKRCTVAVVPSTGGDPIIGPVTLDLAKGTLTRIFAFGDPAEGTADAIVQELDLKVVGARKPTTVDTGTGGQAAALLAGRGPAGPAAPVSAALGALGLLLLVLSRVGANRAVAASVGSRHAR